MASFDRYRSTQNLRNAPARSINVLSRSNSTDSMGLPMACYPCLTTSTSSVICGGVSRVRCIGQRVAM